METQNQTMDTDKSQGFLSKLEDFFNTYLHKKAPFHLPPAAREWIVKYGPWIVLVLMVLALPVILAAFSLSAVLQPFCGQLRARAFLHRLHSFGSNKPSGLNNRDCRFTRIV